MAGAARIVLRDWSIGKFDRFTTPSSAPPVINTAAATTQSESSLYVNDEAILSTIQTRKERRKRGGLVRFTYGSIDPRKVAVEEPWNGLEESDDDDEVDDDEAGVEGMDVDGEDEDEDEENEDEEDEEEDEEASDAEMGDSEEGEEDDEDADQDDEIEVPRLSHKQKRKREPERSTMPSPPTKKVAFGVMPPARGSKSDRQKIGSSTKGILKESRSKPTATASSNPVHKISEKKKGKIANVTPAKIKAEGKKNLALARQSKDKSEAEVYDFGKFF